MYRLTQFAAPAHWTTRGTPAELTARDIATTVEDAALWPSDVNIATSEHLLPAWTFARYQDDTRVVDRDLERADRATRDRTTEVHGLIVEYEDEPTADRSRIAAWWSGIGHVAYTTAWHEQPLGERPPGPRWRVLVPFTKPVSVSQAVQVAQWARHPRRHAGAIAESTERVWRVSTAPAMIPGGYDWTSGDGPALESLAAREQLATWLEEDARAAARHVLSPLRLEAGAKKLRAWVAKRVAHPDYALGGATPELPTLGPEALTPTAHAGPDLPTEDALWPGRVALLVGAPESGRTSLLVQVALTNAERGLPVLLVAARSSTEELVARLVALRCPNPGPTPLALSAALLRGAAPEDALLGPLESLPNSAPLLVLWTPDSHERTVEGLLERVRALARLTAKAPLVLIDDWPADQALADALNDVVRPTAEGAGAAAMVTTAAPDGWPDTPEALDAAFHQHRLPLPQNPLVSLASVALAIALAPEGHERVAQCVVFRNHHGATSSRVFRFIAPLGRFEGPPTKP